MKTKIKQKSNKFALQASRLNKPPAKLKELMSLVNCLPVDELKLALLHPSNLRAQAEARIRGMLGPDVNTDFFLEFHYSHVILENIETLSAKLRDYVFRGRMKEKETLLEVMAEGSVVTRYLNLWNAHTRLRKIAALALEEPKAHLGHAVLWNPSVPFPVLDKIDDRGFVRVSKDLFTEAMDEADIEAARIRECGACKRIFWAGRTTQKGCSARCGDIIRKRRYRERYSQGFYQGAKLTEKDKAALKLKS